MRQREEVRDYFTRDAERFDAIYRAGEQGNLVQRTVDALFRRRHLRERQQACVAGVDGASHVLDVGCGSGRVAMAMVLAGVERLTGIDLSEEMIRLSTELAGKLGLADRCRFVCTPLEAFEPAEAFDAVVALGVMDYVAEPRDVLERLRDLSRGRVVVSFPNRCALLNVARRLWLATKRCPVYFYSRRQIEELFGAAGLDVVTYHRIGSPLTTASCVVVGARRAD